MSVARINTALSAAYPTSVYAEHAGPLPSRPPLAGALDVEVAVVGAGVTGLSTALELAERGLKVAVIERHRVGWGASGRAGGQILAGFSSGLDGLIGAVGLERAKQFYALSHEAVALVQARIDRHGIACDLGHGHVTAALKQRQITALAREADRLARDFDHTRLVIWDRAQTQEAIGSERYVGGLFDAAALHLDPLAYTLGLARAAEAAGVTIYEGTPLDRLEEATPGARLITPQGPITARHVVLAGNAYLGRTVPALTRLTMPLATCIVATAPLTDAQRAQILPGRVAVADANQVLDYFRLSGDGRLLFGGLARYDGRLPHDIRAALKPRLARVFPQLADLPLTHGWGGVVSLTRNRLPDWGRIGKHGFYVQGCSGHGLALGTFAGKLIAEAVSESQARYDLFAGIDHRPFPGGWVRTPALIAAMAYFRLRDLL